MGLLGMETRSWGQDPAELQLHAGDTGVPSVPVRKGHEGTFRPSDLVLL